LRRGRSCSDASSGDVSWRVTHADDYIASVTRASQAYHATSPGGVQPPPGPRGDECHPPTGRVALLKCRGRRRTPSSVILTSSSSPGASPNNRVTYLGMVTLIDAPSLRTRTAQRNAKRYLLISSWGRSIAPVGEAATSNQRRRNQNPAADRTQHSRVKLFAA
jgi:hypothetical protein